MSKELEALEPSVVLKFVDDLLKRYEGKTDYNIYITKDWLLEIKQSLQRLEAIDNAEPSEALRCILDIKNNYKFYVHNKKDIDYQCDVIEQALLKAQKEHKALDLLMQELDCKDFAELRKYARCGYEKLNKHYLKWEDLEFKEETSRIEVKLNETLYSLSCVKRQYLDFVYLINNDSQIRLNSANDIQFFNDLHLERVEE